MALQNGPAQGGGLPGTACAPDLFTRFRGLKGLPKDVAAMPVRAYLGFIPGGPFNVGNDSFVHKLWKAIAERNDLPYWQRTGGTVVAMMILMTLWVLAWIIEIPILLGNFPAGCNAEALQAVQADIAQKKLAAFFGGIDVEMATRVDIYAGNYICPTMLVTAGDAIAAYLANEIEKADCTNYVKANALCEPSMQIIIDTQRYRVGIAETMELWRRDQIPTDAVPEYLRRVGVLDLDQAGFLKTIAADRPGIGDVVQRSMIGVYDATERINNELDTDANLLPKPGALAPEWQKGIWAKELADAWAGHWVPVDVQTAYELYRRGIAGLLPPGTDFTGDDLVDAIKQSNVLPAHRDAIEALAWTPFNRRQILQLLEYSAITPQQALASLVAGGLTQVDAQSQLTQWMPVVAEFKRKRVGASGVSGYLSMFAAGTLGTSELQNELYQLGLSDQEVSDATDEARSQRTRKTRAQLIAFLHGRYVKGDVSDGQVQSVLASTGLDLEDVSNLLRLWRIELEVSPKEPSVNELLDWHCRGIMSDAELATRLAALKYSMADIARIVAVAEYKCMNQMQGEAEKLMGRVTKKLSAAQSSWSKTLGQVGRQVGTVQQRTRTNAGKILSAISAELTAAPSAAGSMASNAAKFAAQNAAAAPVVSGAAVASAPVTLAASTISGSGAATGNGATTAAAVSNPVTASSLAQAASTQNAQEAYIANSLQPQTAPLSASQPVPSVAPGSSPPDASATASETYPASPP